MRGEQPILSAVSIAYAKKHVEKLFEGRRGHGAGKPASRVMSRAELEDNVAIAFELGGSMHSSLSKVGT